VPLGCMVTVSGLDGLSWNCGVDSGMEEVRLEMDSGRSTWELLTCYSAFGGIEDRIGMSLYENEGTTRMRDWA